MKFDLKKLNKMYVNKKELQLRKLESEKLALSDLINKKNKELEEKLTEFEKKREVNNSLRFQFEKYKEALIERGIIFEIENRISNVREWDNLLLNKRGSSYYIFSKKDEEVFQFETDISRLFDEIFKGGYKISVVVVRITPKCLKLQLSFIKK